MRIVWSLPVRGSESMASRGDLVRARRLAEGLRAEGHEVRLVDDSNGTGGKLSVSAYRSTVRRVLPGRSSLVIRDGGRWIHNRLHGRRVLAEARRWEANVLVETQVHFSDSGAVVAKAAGLPLVLDDCAPLSEEIGFGIGSLSLARWLFRRQLGAATRVVVPSRELRQHLLEDGAREERLQVVPNGLDLESHQAAERESGRRRLGVKDEIVIGFVGSFQPWHRVHLLAEAMAGLDPDLPIRMVVVGDGPGRERTLKTARAVGVEDRLTAPGAVEPGLVPSLLAAFDIGVLPGTNDYCHPMKLVEYAAAGLPSVAPDLSPVRDLVRHEETGLLFRTGDVAGLARAMERLARDPALRRRMGRAARSRVTPEHSWRFRARALVEGL